MDGRADRGLALITSSAPLAISGGAGPRSGRTGRRTSACGAERKVLVRASRECRPPPSAHRLRADVSSKVPRAPTRHRAGKPRDTPIEFSTGSQSSLDLATQQTQLLGTTSGIRQQRDRLHIAHPCGAFLAVWVAIITFIVSRTNAAGSRAAAVRLLGRRRRVVRGSDSGSGGCGGAAAVAVAEDAVADLTTRTQHFGEPFFLQWNITTAAISRAPTATRRAVAELTGQQLLAVLDDFSAFLAGSAGTAA